MGILFILLALAIIGFIFYFVSQASKEKPGAPTKSFIKDAGVDTSSYKGMLDSTQKILKDAEKSRADIP